MSRILDEFVKFDEDFHKNSSQLNIKDSGELQLWPNPKRFKISSAKDQFKWIEGQHIQYYTSINASDFSQLLVVSGLSNIALNYQLAFESNASDAASNLIIVEDGAYCNKTDSYELQLQGSVVTLVSGGRLGTLYALRAFVQLLGSGLTHEAIWLSDYSDVQQRSVLWSYRWNLLANCCIKEHIDSLSKSKINTIYLNVDGEHLDSKIIEDILSLTKSYFINVIPLVHINSIRHKLPANLTSSLNSTVAVIVSLDQLSITNELNAAAGTVDQKHSNDELISLSTKKLEEILNELSNIGFTSITIASSNWAKAAINPKTIIESHHHTFQVAEVEYAILYPALLWNKPIICVQDYVQSLYMYSVKVEEQGSKVSVFPCYNERDYMFPHILQKYYQFLYAGFIWNKLPILDKIRSGKSTNSNNNTRSNSILSTFSSKSSYNLSSLRAIIQKEILSSSYFPVHSPAVETILHILTGELVHTELQNKSTNSNDQSTTLDSNNNNSTLSSILTNVTFADLAKAEKLMWSLSTSDTKDTAIMSVPSKSEASLCFRMYRKAIITAQWNTQFLKKSTKKLPTSDNNVGALVKPQYDYQIDCNDFYSAINLLNVLSRAIVLSYNAASEATDTQNVTGGNDNIQNIQKRAAVYDNVDLSKPFIPKTFPKDEEIKDLLMKVVQQNILFRNYKSDEHQLIVEAFECIHAEENEIVIKQGDSGEYFYIIESGSVDVFMETNGLKIRVGRTLSRGDYFGELALMYNTPRAATVICSEPSIIWRMDRQTYRTIVTQHNKANSAKFIGLISNVKILGQRLGDVLSEGELNKLVSTLELEEFEDGSVIIRQGLTGDYFYIIIDGVVDVWQETAEAILESNIFMGKKVATLTRGDYFGEKALLADDVRQASCVAVGKVMCLSLSRDDFIGMLGRWQDLKATDKVGGSNNNDGNNNSGSPKRTSKLLSMSLDDLEIMSTLGVGAFGKVKLASHKTTRQQFALKAQAKIFITTQNMQAMILSEMNIMKMIDHSCVVKLFSAFQDTRYIYFVLELLPGGEFFNYLQIAGKLSEDKARFYSAAVVSAFEELHKHKIAYRDLKPENMVMDERGYVKLVDLGLAKQILSGSTWTMCGTPDYLAPEIVLNKGHDLAVDYWALGVLIFEMIHGWPPFYHDNPMKIYEKIISGKVNYPENFSTHLEELISKLLMKNPSKRLGNMKGGIVDIIKHKWFGSFDWKGLLNGSIVPHYVPDINMMKAVGNFNEDDDEEAEESDWVAEL